MYSLPDLAKVEGFEWDPANTLKNWRRHKVAFQECEEVFLRAPVILPDTEHSITEPRFYAFGKTLAERRLTITFTLRKNKIRVISARPASRKERNIYEEI